jgi:hypothetical protein
MDRTTARGGRSLTSCRKAASVLADGMPCTFCGCSSAGRARPFQGRGHEFETRHPLHFGCVHALRGHTAWCWWPGMCAAQGLSHVQRDTTSDGMLAFGHSRSGLSVWSCSSRRPRTPGFQSGNAGSKPARDTSSRSPYRAHASRVEIGRNDWAAPEPVTGWICQVASLTQWPECRPV